MRRKFKSPHRGYYTAPPWVRVSLDTALAAKWGVEDQKYQKVFGDGFIEALRDNLEKTEERVNKVTTANVILSALIFLYINGLALDFQPYGLKITKINGFVEMLVILSGMSGVAFSLGHMRMLLLRRAIGGFVNGLKLPFLSTLARARYDYQHIMEYFGGVGDSVTKIESKRWELIRSIAFVPYILIGAISIGFYIYVQILGVQFVFEKSALSDWARLTIGWIAIALNFTALVYPIFNVLVPASVSYLKPPAEPAKTSPQTTPSTSETGTGAVEPAAQITQGRTSSSG
jgi:hypothetical protein